MAVALLPTAMGLPLITLQPGGSRPPTTPQKANILAILGASAIGHGHALSDIVGLVAALGAKLGIHKNATAPVDTELLWFNTATNALAVFHDGSWRVFSGGGAGIVSSTTPPTNHSVIWHDTVDNTLNYWDGAVWVTDSTIPLLPSGEVVVPPEEDTLPTGTYFLVDSLYLADDAGIVFADTI